MDKVLGVVREQKYGSRHPFPEFAEVVTALVPSTEIRDRQRNRQIPMSGT